MVPPAVTVGGPIFATDRSAIGETPVVTLSVLLDGSGSDVVVAIVAVLVREPA